jgi:benzoyl-CoA reductase/2-hydroxyglutaryl-CoA dehydratase subunit BcrC/BadD/HgdB
MKTFLNELESHFGVSVDDEKIHDAIKDANEVRKRLQKLSSFRSTKNIGNREYLEVLIRCLQSAKKELLPWLDNIILDWSSRPPFPAGFKKVLLTGSDITYVEWMDTLDQCNVRVVRDDLSVGERYFARLIPLGDDPLQSLASYYLSVPRPATKPGIDKRLEYLINALKETETDGIISQNLKFCEPFAYDSVTVNNALKERNNKLIHFEREFTPVTDHQLINRISAFTETL